MTTPAPVDEAPAGGRTIAEVFEGLDWTSDEGQRIARDMLAIGLLEDEYPPLADERLRSEAAERLAADYERYARRRA